MTLPAPPAQPAPPPPLARPATPANPAPHTTLIARVAALEDALTKLSAQHNAFVGDVVEELGL